MTGIDRLRTLAGAWDAYGLGGALGDIARQIERERACDADTIENVRLIVGGVVDEMERHILGHEGMEDSPVARWASELRRALKSDASDGAEQQNPSCADAAETADVTSEAVKVTRGDREAIAWVREHGGLEKIIKQRRDSVPRAAFERKLGKRLRHIAECEEALRRRNATISALEKTADLLRKQIADMRPRLMPEGMEWPRYTDGSLVEIGDEVVGPDYGEHINVDAVKFHANGFTLFDKNGFDKWYESDDRFERPTPKVLDADGAEIEVGDDLYSVEGSLKFHVSHVDCINGKIATDAMFSLDKWADPAMYTHRAPVLAADGKPLREGETVWYLDHIDPLEVTGVSTTSSCGPYVNAYNDYEGEVSAPARCFSHERPVADSWERIEEDADALAEAEINGEGSYNAANDYCTRHGLKDGTVWVLVAQDLVRRARALAERDA